jgi:flavin reductase (DIM6/NTAB) family NADH-FMN oxidoreductase RutF
MTGAGDAAGEAFDALVASLDRPMLIVTAADGAERDGCLVAFATQTSIDPRRFAVCISRVNRTYRVAQGAPVLAVHVVPSDGAALAELFGAETGDEVDKLAHCEWSPGPGGAPVLAGCPSWFAGRVVARHDAGDHEAFLLDPLAAAHDPGAGTFPFSRAKRIEPGHPA